jgi:NAD(P)-dependent dehydrogenase (short-subunit alcohol dehydrogenase family)
MSSATSINGTDAERLPKTKPATGTDDSLQPWHFFVLLSRIAATAAVVLAREARPEHLVLISLTMGAAGFAGAALYRTLAPLVGKDDPAGGGVMTYRASKAAVIQFTKSAAIELAHYEIRVNAIAPGNIRTAIVRKSATGEDLEKLEQFEAKIRQQMRDDRPLKREGTVEDVAEAALYFATDRSRYVTGTVLPVDGGTVAGKVIPRK